MRNTGAATDQKRNGSYYTPDAVVQMLVRWSVRAESDRLLDPACGDGRFLAAHRNSFGVDRDCSAAVIAARRAPKSTIHVGDFFAWAGETSARFECAAGNPPFIRYQHFSGEQRQRALALCERLGAKFSGLSSSWAPFLAATTNVLKPGGRISFVVPAEIGHAPYAAPLIEFLSRRFGRVHIVAIRDKVFPKLSEDVWLLFADGFGGTTDFLDFSQRTQLGLLNAPPKRSVRVSLAEWKQSNCRLRSFLLKSETRSLYRSICDSPSVVRLGRVASVGIGYVTGANEFFHLRPSEAERLGIPQRFLLPSVRNAKSFPEKIVNRSTIRQWKSEDKPAFLLRLNANDRIPTAIADYLDSAAGRDARTGYKCRNRKPWYVVPDVKIPSAFLSYMSGKCPQLITNQAECSCTNSIHAIQCSGAIDSRELSARWQHPIRSLSCEIEGHPLGGGMLKLEPREAARIALPETGFSMSKGQQALVEEGIDVMRKWRHHG